jgi:uncharacterized protein (DUF433 family)
MDAAPISHIEIINGKAMVGGRYKAKLVAAMIVKAGASIDEAMEHYGLTRAEIHAALAYYFDNQRAVEQSFRDAEAYARDIGISADDLVQELRARGQIKSNDK